MVSGGVRGCLDEAENNSNIAIVVKWCCFYNYISCIVPVCTNRADNNSNSNISYNMMLL